MNVVPLPQPDEDPFGIFWTLYPRHIAKKDARRAWTRIAVELHGVIYTAIVDWRPIWRERDPDYQFVPYPASWLNGERWADELPPRLSSHLSHVLTAPTDPCERTAMPDKVRQMLAKLRGKG